jgi:hypothetical protein
VPPEMRSNPEEKERVIQEEKKRRRVRVDAFTSFSSSC